MKHHFETLGLQEGASQQAIQEAYDRLSRELNPSNNDNQEFFIEEYKKVQEAYKALYNTSILATEKGASKSIPENSNLKTNQKTDDSKILKNESKFHNITLFIKAILEKLRVYKKSIIICISAIILIGLVAYKFIIPYINLHINYNKGVSIMKTSKSPEKFREATSYFEKVIQVSGNFKKVDSLHLRSIYQGLVLLNNKTTEKSLLSGSQIDLYIPDINTTYTKISSNILKIFYILNKDTIPNYINKKELYIGLTRFSPTTIPFSPKDTISIAFWVDENNDFYSKKLNLNKPKISDIIVKDALEIIGALDSINIDYLWYKTGKGRIVKGDYSSPIYYEKIIKYYPTNQTKETHYDQHQKFFKLYNSDFVSARTSESANRIINKMGLINNTRLKNDPWVNLLLAKRNYGSLGCYKCTNTKLKSTLTLFDKVLNYRLAEGFNARFIDSLLIAQTYKDRAAVLNDLKLYTKAIINYTKALNYYPNDFSPENTSDRLYNNPRGMNIQELTHLYYHRASVKFSKSDWLGCMSDYKKALSYYDNDYKDVPKVWSVIRPESILRNLFSAKWNYGENGDKRGACEDLKIAADLDPEEYYDYYIKNCSK
jgi:tetratricopeptide (TPR) repeat protein